MPCNRIHVIGPDHYEHIRAHLSSQATFFFGRYTYRMDKWLTVPSDLEPFIGCALALYSLYCPKKTLIPREWDKRVQSVLVRVPEHLSVEFCILPIFIRVSKNLQEL
jgi:hypothetical protein